MIRFARWSFGIAGLYGLLILAPQYFLEKQINQDFPPPITHPEHFYGFLGTALAWQIAFLVIARDPLRYRLLMVPAVIEKFSFGLAVLWLLRQDRIAPQVVPFGVIDLALGSLFLFLFLRLRADDIN